MRALRIAIPALVLLIVVALGMPNQVTEAQQFGSGWVASYYSNASLSGNPEIGRIDGQINFNFGEGSPAPGFIPADGFSVRWNSLEQFDAAGRYRFTVQADERARVFIDGNLIIDQFGNTGGAVVASADVDLTAGAHDIVVEYADLTGNALIQFFWDPFSVVPTNTPGPSPTPTATQPPPVPPGALAATVIRASVLNVRDAPSLGGRVISKTFRGQTYQVVGRDPEAEWFLLQLSNFQGWAYGYYLFFNLNEFTAPVRSATTLFPLPAGFQDTGVIAQTEAGMKLRAEPNVLSPQTGRIGWGEFLPVVARTPANDWYQVLWKGTIGWVYSPYTEIVQGDLGAVPVANPQ